MIEYYACTKKGKSRNINEDRIMVDSCILSKGSRHDTLNNSIVTVVCDGVGGDNAGEIAAEISAKSFIDFKIPGCSPFKVTQHLQGVNDLLIREQKSIPDTNGMASTIAGILISDKRFLSFNLGDTRIYRSYKGNLDMLSTDHTNTFSFVCPDALTGYLGGDGTACSPSLRKGDIESETTFIVCSDGIYKAVKEIELHKILYSDQTAEQKGRAIMKQAEHNGSDDMSLVLIWCTY